MARSERFDFIVIGAGMAGASVAAGLAADARVALLDAEAHAGYHTTGRSAALYSALYGNTVIRGLTRASRSFLFESPEGFSPVPLVKPRATVFFGRPDQQAQLDRLHAELGAGVAPLNETQTRELLPVFAPDYLAGGLLDTGSADLDVDALLQGFLRQFKARGGHLYLGCPAEAATQLENGWTVRSGEREFHAPVLINAAGAWGDEIAALAGVAPMGLEPKRRTALLIPVPEGLEAAAWPAAIDADETFYFKPDAGLLLLSPADETPSPPCDSQPEELDVAIAVDRFEWATGAQVRQVKHRWAGLRVFSADRSPVVGFDPIAPGFFWLVGQGGYGIQTAPALARAAAALASGAVWPTDLAAEGVRPEALSPARFRCAG